MTWSVGLSMIIGCGAEGENCDSSLDYRDDIPVFIWNQFRDDLDGNGVDDTVFVAGLAKDEDRYHPNKDRMAIEVQYFFDEGYPPILETSVVRRVHTPTPPGGEQRVIEIRRLDWDADGTPEIGARYWGGEIDSDPYRESPGWRIFRYPGSTEVTEWEPWIVLPGFSHTNDAFGDFDGDGLPDLLRCDADDEAFRDGDFVIELRDPSNPAAFRASIPTGVPCVEDYQDFHALVLDGTVVDPRATFVAVEDDQSRRYTLSADGTVSGADSWLDATTYEFPKGCWFLHNEYLDSFPTLEEASP